MLKQIRIYKNNCKLNGTNTGKAAFTFDILEKLKEKDDPYFNQKEALLEIEEKWLEKLQPYGEQGYNSK